MARPSGATGEAVIPAAKPPRPSRPIGPIGPTVLFSNQLISGGGVTAAPCPTASCYGTSQTCRGCRGEGKFGSLDAWKFGILVVKLFHLSPACRAFCSPWPWKVWPFGPARSVLRSPGAKAPLPCRGVGQRPTPSNHPIPPITQNLCVLCGSSEPLWVPRSVGPSFQTSKLPIQRPACASTPLICSKSVNYRRSS